jgi:hypothetical protein
MVVPPELNIVLRWNSQGSDAGAVGHAATADAVNTGTVEAKIAPLDTFAREWRAVTILVSPGNEVLSVTDRNMRRLSAYTEGSISDRERKRLLDLLGFTDPQPYSIRDLYALVPEEPKIWG